MDVRYEFHAGEIGREPAMPHEEACAQQNEACEVAAGARLGGKENVILPEQPYLEILSPVAGLPHGLEQDIGAGFRCLHCSHPDAFMVSMIMGECWI